LGGVSEQGSGEIHKDLKDGEMLNWLGRVAIHWGDALGVEEILREMAGFSIRGIDSQGDGIGTKKHNFFSVLE